MLSILINYTAGSVKKRKTLNICFAGAVPTIHLLIIFLNSALDELAELMKKHAGWKLKIEGHTDNVGKASSNTLLSKNRANAVKTYLTKKGVAATRFEVTWYGPDKPIADNSTEEGRQKNRRVEMTLME